MVRRKRLSSSLMATGSQHKRLNAVNADGGSQSIPRPCRAVQQAVCSDRAQNQHEVMLSIEQAWRAARDEDGEQGSDAALLLQSLRKKIDRKPCPHADRRVCWTCAGAKNPSWDVDILYANTPEDYTFQGALMDGRRAADVLERWKNDNSERSTGIESMQSCISTGEVDLLDDTQRYVFKDDAQNAQETVQKVINAFKNGTARQQALLKVSADLSKGELHDEEGMRFTCPKIEEEICMLWNRCAIHLLRPTSCSLAKSEWTFTEFFTCIEGSIAIVLWPAAKANWILLGMMMLHNDIHRVEEDPTAYETDLRSPYVVHLRAGQMIAIPPMTIWKRIAITKAVALTFYAIPKLVCQKPILNSILDKLTLLRTISPDKDGNETFEDEVSLELGWWIAIRDGMFNEILPWAREVAKEVVDILSSFSASQNVDKSDSRRNSQLV